MSGDLQPVSPNPAGPPHVEPAVFIASLSDDVNGIVPGRWVCARVPLPTLEVSAAEVLATSRWAARTGEPAEEWIILDREGFPAPGPDPHESLADVARLARTDSHACYPAADLGSHEVPWCPE